MIGILYNFTDRNIGALVLAAFRRSVTASGVVSVALCNLPLVNFLVVINPNEEQGKKLITWLECGSRKLIIFGRLPDCLLNHFGVTLVQWPEPIDRWARSPIAQSGHYAESKATLHYLPTATELGAGEWQRALERFDFTDEWNNLGYGAIRMDESAWSLSSALRVPESAEIANVQIDGQVIASYCALFNEQDSSIIWVNREAGLIDSFEWRLIERFICDWRSNSLPCLPVVSEIPFGYDAAITMRLDCDEDITSAKDLWLAYCDVNVPLSLAIHTNNLHDNKHVTFLKEFVESGGALLSHTATHAPNWGGSYESAQWEGRESRHKIEKATGVYVNYAVSPFHQSPPYALAALCDIGYQGCIGGIIRNDPEFLIARGGELAHLPEGFVGHSQQSMLHGDCMLTDRDDPLTIFKQSFDRALETRSLFGYLDHPFSERYQYGWKDEESRITAHLNFIAYIRERADHPIFLDECQALDFLRYRSAIRIRNNAGKFITSIPRELDGLRFAVEFCGKIYEITDGVVLT
ncbi:polysaccharide deacetylase family protein [Dickeya parazeae]|uniref:polysaccharide deacetylase family protein n=1 Tax=Dickeya parazeae TaxID=2893572 RepID=UPI001AEC778E|nr:polysaccharide deacetylase family protein [Dickeya parazeae]MBP2834505.1 polysaccharide deacetylase [Dickeya parazeae]